jgi:pimeloyl-ACP methyl ester carboxylesterase
MEKKYRIVILPGWGGSHETWQDFVDMLKEKYLVSVIDLPCFGAVPCPDSVWGVGEYAKYVKEKLTEYKGEQVVLLGHSFGGQIAAYVAARNPNSCAGLILSGAAVYRPNRYVKRGILWVVAKIGKIIFRIPFVERFDVWAKKVLYRAVDSPDYRHTEGIQRDIFIKIIRQNMSKELGNIHRKTLVVSGNKDRYVPLRFSKRIHRHIPNSRLEIIPGGTHGLHIYKKKSLFEAVNRFIISL